MKLRYRDDGMIEPCIGESISVFMHYSGGMTAVRKSYFYQHVVPVMNIHSDDFKLVNEDPEPTQPNR